MTSLLYLACSSSRIIFSFNSERVAKSSTEPVMFLAIPFFTRRKTLGKVLEACWELFAGDDTRPGLQERDLKSVTLVMSVK